MGKKSQGQVILIVDDSEDDYEATTRALQRNKNLANPLRRCENGQEALDYLFQRGEYKAPDSAPRPGLILLDLNMPGVDGREVLKEIKEDANLRSIPVVVMTNSDNDKDIQSCYELGANSYIVKPLEWGGFFDAISRLKEYWFEIAILPEN